MKKIMLIMALAAILMASCQKETLDPNSDQAIAASSALSSSSGLSSLDQSINSEFMLRHRPGRDSSCGKIPLDSLAQSIKDYIATNFPGATIELAAKDRAGYFYTIIKLADGAIKILQFDANGSFVKELDKKAAGPKGPHGPKDPRKHITSVDPSTLLLVITNYIDTNYTGATILKAGTTASAEYLVLISFNGSNKVLLFDAKGNFVKELK